MIQDHEQLSEGCGDGHSSHPTVGWRQLYLDETRGDPGGNGAGRPKTARRAMQRTSCRSRTMLISFLRERGFDG